jgi:ParB-like chromosome segregation protein Spo0J
MKIEYLKPSDLKRYARNPRLHNAKQIREIAKSIERYGFNAPILIDDDRNILAGHGRLAAAKHLKLAEVPCANIGTFTEAEKRAYTIGDNKIALNGEWDEATLAAELQELLDAGADPTITGFAVGEIEMLIGAEIGNDDNEEPYKKQFAVIVICEGPEDQASTLEGIRKQGYAAKAIIT